MKNHFFKTILTILYLFILCSCSNQKIVIEKTPIYKVIPTYTTEEIIINSPLPITRKEIDINKIYAKAFDLFINSKNYNQTNKLTDEIINQDSQNYKAYNLKGIAQCYLGSLNQGMKNIDKSLEIKSDYGYARFNKALAYELFNQYEEALFWYDKNLEIENYVWSYYGKSSIYGRRGDVKNTVKYLKTAISLDKVCKELAKTEKDFDNVRGAIEFATILKK